MSAVDEHAEAHRLKDELGYGARRIGRELGISRYAAEQLLAQPLPQPVAEPVAEVVGQVADEVAEQPSAGPVLVIELDRFPGLAEDVAVLTRTGRGQAEAVAQALGVIADAYRTALRGGRIEPEVPFFVPPIELRAAPWLRRAA